MTDNLYFGVQPQKLSETQAIERAETLSRLCEGHPVFAYYDKAVRIYWFYSASVGEADLAFRVVDGKKINA